MGAFARLAGLIFEPAKTFEDIARRPTFLLPMALTIIFGLVFMGVYSHPTCPRNSSTRWRCR
jgi:hypothetical protein